MKKVAAQQPQSASQFTDEVDEADIGVPTATFSTRSAITTVPALRTAAERPAALPLSPACIAYIRRQYRGRNRPPQGQLPTTALVRLAGSGHALYSMLTDSAPAQRIWHCRKCSTTASRSIYRRHAGSEFDKDRYAAIVNRA